MTKRKISSLRRMVRLWFHKDKEYYTGLLRTIKDDFKRNLVLAIGLFVALVATLAYMVFGSISFNVFQAILLVSVLGMLIISGLVGRKKSEKKKSGHNLDPVSLGTFHFGFAISLWIIWAKKQVINQPLVDLRMFIVALGISVISVLFFVAAFSDRTRKFINMKAAILVLLMTFIASWFGFVYGILDFAATFPSAPPLVGIIVAFVVYFGFLWLSVITATLFRDGKNKLVNTLFEIFFFVVALVMLLVKHNYIGGAGLLFMTGLIYLVDTGHVKLHGKFNEE